MALIRALQALHPSWRYASDGTKEGVIFDCPDCPAGMCRVEKVWGPRAENPGESFTSMGHLTIEDLGPGSREGCEFRGKLQVGTVFSL